MALRDLFKRKKEEPSVGTALLRMARDEPDQFAAFIEERTVGERMMILVGQSVAKITIQVAEAVARRTSQPLSLDGLVGDMERSYRRHAGTDEVVSRRLWWCLVGACVFEFGRVADASRTEAGGRVWAALLSSLEIANTALADNSLWSKDEKALFLFPDLRIGVQVLGKSEVPKPFRTSQAMTAFAASNDVDLTRRF